MIRRYFFLLDLFSILFLFLCLFFLLSLSGSFIHYHLDPSPFYCTVPILLGLLVLAPVMPSTSKLRPRLLLACWLALLLRSAFDPLFVYEFPLSTFPWTAYLIYGLILALPLLVCVSKTVAALGPVKLTVLAGFAIWTGYTVLNIAYGYGWFSMFIRLGLGIWARPDDSGWSSYFLTWLGYPEWLGYRLITYIGLGYLLVRHMGLFFGMAMCMLIAVTETIISWLVFLPYAGEFEAGPLSAVLQYAPDALLKALFAQIAILSLVGLSGALIARVRPLRVHRPVRIVSITKVPHRRARHILSGDKIAT